MKTQWIGESREAGLADFGQPMIGFEEGDAIPADEQLASILGWEAVLKDDDASPYELEGVVEKDGETFAVFSFSRNLAMGKDYRYSAALVLTSAQAAAVREWTDARLAARGEGETKAARVAALLREHGLDEAFVRAKREQLLREHGLL